MATFDTSRTTYGSSIVAGRISTLVTRAIIAIIAWNDARVTRKALSALTDRELEDIGLTRADIDLVAENKIVR
jgi:uncharacterized protein YjiS (DUF1127 family)